MYEKNEIDPTSIGAYVRHILPRFYVIQRVDIRSIALATHNNTLQIQQRIHRY